MHVPAQSTCARNGTDLLSEYSNSDSQSQVSKGDSDDVCKTSMDQGIDLTMWLDVKLTYTPKLLLDNIMAH